MQEEDVPFQHEALLDHTFTLLCINTLDQHV